MFSGPPSDPGKSHCTKDHKKPTRLHNAQRASYPDPGELSRSPGWFWVYCNNRECSHHVLLPIAPFAIRWGLDASSDALRRNLKCSAGHRGASLSAPFWRDLQTGFEPFPVGLRYHATRGGFLVTLSCLRCLFRGEQR